MTIDEQPVSHVQWVDRHRVQANSWNPNRVAPPELRLLKLSIVEDGWTQPIVVREPDEVDAVLAGNFEVVDGFHRWTVSDDKEVFAMTEGMVPVVTLQHPDPAHRRMSTIRHNRARGTHHVLKMADIVATLSEELDLNADEIQRRLGMDDEEVRRLLERGKMTKRAAAGEFTEAWRPAPVDRDNPPPGSRLTAKETTP